MHTLNGTRAFKVTHTQQILAYILYMHIQICNIGEKLQIFNIEDIKSHATKK